MIDVSVQVTNEDVELIQAALTALDSLASRYGETKRRDHEKITIRLREFTPEQIEKLREI